MIDVKNLSKSFGHIHVLKNINEHIYPGEKVVICLLYTSDAADD